MAWRSFAVLLLCIAGCEGLKMKSQIDARCPDIKDNNNVLFWGMLMDGKDHPLGKDAYNWHGFIPAYKSLDFLMQTKPDEELTFDKLMQARKICCGSAAGKGNFDWATKPSDLEGPIFRAYTCLECNHMKKLLKDVPEKYLKVKKGTNPRKKESPTACDDISAVTLKPKTPADTKKEFKGLLTSYNADIKNPSLTRPQKIARLASYLKDYAFLHPWGNGNGRFRAMMLTYEVRRLGLGCGTMMYNNNKDMYYITKEMYATKIEEGIAMYESAVDTGKSPWLDEAVVKKHMDQFAASKTIPGLLNCRSDTMKKGSMNLDVGQLQAEEEVHVDAEEVA